MIAQIAQTEGFVLKCVTVWLVAVGESCKGGGCQVRQTRLMPAVTVQKCAAFPALMLIMPVSLCSSHPLLVSQLAVKSGIKNKGINPLLFLFNALISEMKIWI